MVQDYFRSESEDRSSLLDSEPCLPLIGGNDPVNLHPAEYEENLLMEYIGESQESFGERDNLGPVTSSGDSLLSNNYNFCDFEVDHNSVKGDRWENDSNSSHLSSNVKAKGEWIRSDFVNRPYPYAYSVKNVSKVSGTAPQPVRRGRPMKITSNSKMASYARNYREMKKSQLQKFEIQVKELQEENRNLHIENQRLNEGFIQLNQEVEYLRQVIERDSRLSSFVSKISGPRKLSGVDSFPEEKDSIDVPLLSGNFESIARLTY